MNKKKNENSSKNFIIFIIVGSIFAGISLISPFIFYFLSKYFDSIVINKNEILYNSWTETGLLPKETLKDYILELGPLGDLTAGTTVPFLTFAGFIILIGTMFMQKSELELTRNELSQTQKVFKEQSETMLLQRFENTFFQLLSLHNENVSTMSLKINRKPFSMNRKRENIDEYTGKDTFPEYKKILLNYLNTVERSYESELNILHQIFISTRENYNRFYLQQKQELGHYFRNLYRFIKFIDEFTGLDNEKKSEYVDLIRAQLSADEMTLLIYNGLSSNGQAFQLFMVKYDLLDGVDVTFVHDELILTLFKKFDQVMEYDNSLKALQ
ncbi:putative phage abortive infection protein [Bacillus infantis]|uniref:putative phage abortive infection protein n=1 Tax=Bacillus infantis TaxID=324767 RepID=UPI002155BD6B|nr:putative phage abortive infection protein [Bacillus infantis]